MNCAVFAGDWIRLATGRDPVGPWRDCSEDVAGNRWGGLVALTARAMRRHGFMVTSEPRYGDIGVITYRDQAGRRIVCAIKISGGWIFRISTTLSRVPDFAVRTVMAWRIRGE